MKQVIWTMVLGLVLSTSGVMATEKTPDTIFSPFEEMQKMQKEMDSIFDRFHQNMMKEDRSSQYTFSFPTTPVMDFVDKGDYYLLKVDIPGAEKSKIDITVEENVLKIEAQTSKDKKEESKGYLKQERFVSSYKRMITLPGDADAEKFESEYADGVLIITIPKNKK